jgi:tRNA threonylcarbamoyladenosine biosynthesis protein TsaB
MLLLALDTTTRTGSSAIARDGVVIGEEASDATRDHAAQLPAAVAALVEHAGVALDRIDAFAVATGPGSFTGLRIGIACMQGLAVATGKPLVGVSAFDALAALGRSADRQNPSNQQLIATWVDAWRGEVFAALYDHEGTTAGPIVDRPDRLLDSLVGRPTLFIGDGAQMYRALITERLGNTARFAEPLMPALAGAIAQLATREVMAGHAPPPDAITPLYVRRSDAEISRAEGGLDPRAVK